MGGSGLDKCNKTIRKRKASEQQCFTLDGSEERINANLQIRCARLRLPGTEETWLCRLPNGNFVCRACTQVWKERGDDKCETDAKKGTLASPEGLEVRKLTRFQTFKLHYKQDEHKLNA